MSYRVVTGFFDMQDDAHHYLEGDTYPRRGYKPDARRINDLLTGANVVNRIMIEPVAKAKEAPTASVAEVSEEK